jgi:BirA family biotin operon repressor/biotin-[acetyl-CoA-carboxylase] ligase
LLGGAKAAGILVESGARAGQGLWVAVGIGVNLASPPAAADRPATSFAAHMRVPPPPAIEALSVLSESLERWRRVWETSGFPVISEAWMGRAHGIGERCVARLPAETLEGIAEGLDTDGAFKLRLGDGRVRRITAGDVFF